VEVLHEVGHDGTIISDSDISRIHETGDVELLLSNAEGELEVLKSVLLLEAVKVDEVGAVLVDESAEGETVMPRAGEVLDVDVTVALGLLLAPVEQTLLGGKILDADILDLETKDKSPHHTKDKLLVVVADFLRADTDELDTAAGDEVEADVKVLDVLKTHARLHGDLWKLLAADAFEQVVKKNTIIQIGLEVIHHGKMTTAFELSVEPVCESLLLDNLPLFIHNRHLGLYSYSKI
jgi:hypothetical protein